MARENQVKVWRAADLDDAEMLKGAYVRHAYPWHAHEELSFGLVMGGAIHLRTRLREGLATPGSFVLINTEEVHQGTPASPEGWRCRTIHLRPDAIRKTAQELRAFAPLPSLTFRSPVIEDRDVARGLLELHQRSEAADSPLDRQARSIALIALLLARHADVRLEAPVDLREPVAIGRARDYLNDRISAKVTLNELAAAAGITPFRLLRAFERATGLTPHAYQTQARVRAANIMIRRRMALADIAAATGFADQAHLTRVFKSIMGATPGQYRAAALTG